MLGLIVFFGLLVSGCTAQYIKDIESAAKMLRSSDEFTDVNFEYQREFDPTRPRDLYDFSPHCATMLTSSERGNY